MAGSGIRFALSARGGHISIRLLFSYAFDWLFLIVVAAIAALLGRIEPKTRPFSLVDPDISFVPPLRLSDATFFRALTANVDSKTDFLSQSTRPFLPSYCSFFAPWSQFASLPIVAIIFVPGPTVPKDTPKTLIWKRKLWELHVGWLGLALALVSAWFFTEGMKNMYGKPRPDLLSRCEPDTENTQKYVVGGFAGESMNGHLFSADICQQKDSYKLNDGFRSYPSGHSSSSAAGLIYTSLFLASKFAVTIPFVVPALISADRTTHAAFPSRMRSEVDPDEPTRARGFPDDHSATSSPFNGKMVARRNAKVQSLRRQAAAPPIYHLIITLMPFCVAVFIHLPIQEGAGWGWGPQSEDRAFWAGVGRRGYAGDAGNLPEKNETHHHDLGETSDTPYHAPTTSGALMQRTAHIDHDHEPRQFQGVELQSSA
ncbi:hypothetical protein EDB80DRAFT_756610 [Ilyonectria destructans]|nr:hypothetical protein EDB80DRAFT_756610 [Ilyonectria destructans]